MSETTPKADPPELRKATEPVVIETDQPGLILVQMTTVEDDQEYFDFQNANEAHIAEYGNTIDPNPEEVTKRRSATGNFRFGIRKDGVLIGMEGYKVSPDGREAEVGILLAKDATGHGYATSALRAMTEHIAPSFERVFAEADPNNQSSLRLCERAGYVLQPNTVQREWQGQVVEAACLEYKK